MAPVGFGELLVHPAVSVLDNLKPLVAFDVTDGVDVERVMELAFLHHFGHHLDFIIWAGGVLPDHLADRFQLFLPRNLLHRFFIGHLTEVGIDQLDFLQVAAVIYIVIRHQLISLLLHLDIGMLEIAPDQDMVVALLEVVEPLGERPDALLLGHQPFGVHHLLLHLVAHVGDVGWVPLLLGVLGGEHAVDCIRQVRAQLGEVGHLATAEVLGVWHLDPRHEV